jgi:hypothetical protein
MPLRGKPCGLALAARGYDAAVQEQRSRIWTSGPKGFLDDLEALISAVAGGSPEREPTRFVGQVDVDAFEAHVGAVKPVKGYDTEADELAAVPIPRRVRDFDPVLVGPDQIAIVRIVPAVDRALVRALAFTGLLVALGFLAFLLGG